MKRKKMSLSPLEVDLIRRFRLEIAQVERHFIHGSSRINNPEGFIAVYESVESMKSSFKTKHNRPRRGEMRAGTASTEAPLGAK